MKLIGNLNEKFLLRAITSCLIRPNFYRTRHDVYMCNGHHLYTQVSHTRTHAHNGERE